MKKQSPVVFCVLAALGLLLMVACAPTPTPVVVKETVPVPQTVTVRETVAAPQTVVVRQTVVAEKVITVTPAPTKAKQFVVGWSPPSDPTEQSRVELDNAVKQGIEEAGGKEIYCSPSVRGGAIGDPATQAACVDTFIAAKVDAAIIYPVDAVAIMPSLKKLNAAGIAVFLLAGYVAPEQGIDVIMNFSGNNPPASNESAKVIIEELTKKYGSPKGLVLEMAGAMQTTDGVERSKFFHDIIDKYPDIKVVRKDAGWDQGKAAVVVEDWMTGNPGTDAMYLAAGSAYLPPTIATLDKIGLWKKIGEKGHIIVTGNDASNIQLYAIRCGYAEMFYDMGWQFGGLPFTKRVMQYLKTGVRPVVGEKFESGINEFPYAVTIYAEGKTGPVMVNEGNAVTIKNVSNPSWYGNMFQGPPNGIKPQCGTAGLWKGDTK